MKQARQIMCPHFTEKETKTQQSRAKQLGKGQVGVKGKFLCPQSSDSPKPSGTSYGVATPS